MGCFHVRAIACLFLVLASCAAAAAQIKSRAAAPVTTRELVEAAGLSGLAVSPDGLRAVVRVDRQDIAQNVTHLAWQVVDLRDGAATTVADGGLPRLNVNGGLEIEHPQWSRDSQWVYFRKVQDEEAQLWRAHREHGRIEQVTHDASDVSAFIVDHHAIHYAVGPATRDQIKSAEQVEYDNGVLLDSSYILGYRPTHNFPVNGRMATYRRSPGAKNFGYATLLGETPLVVKTLQPDFREVFPARPDVVGEFNDLWRESNGGSLPFDPRRRHEAVSASGVRAAVDAADASRAGRGAVLSWTNANGTSRRCTASVCTEADTLSVVGWTRNGSLIFQSLTFGTSALNSLDAKSGRVTTLLRTEAALGSSASGLSGACQIAMDEAVCISAASDQPPRLIAVHLKTGQVRTLFDPNPSLSPDRLGKPNRIVVSDRYGNSTLGRVILPRTYEAGLRLPLVITSYTCGGFLRGGSGKDVPEHVLAGLGFATVCVDSSGGAVRRSPAYTFTLDQSQWSGLDFFEDAVRVLEAQGIVDPDRVMLTGFSGSANSTTFAISHSRMFTAAGVTTGGSSDVMVCYLASHYRNCSTFAEKAGYQRPYDSRTGLWAQSPAWNADRIATPFLMQLPETEYLEMMQLYGAMLDYGRIVEMHIFADAYHLKTQPLQRLAVYDRNVDWANFWLRGVTAPEPDRARQNARWTDLRKQQCKLFKGEGALTDPPWYCRQIVAPPSTK